MLPQCYPFNFLFRLHRLPGINDFFCTAGIRLLMKAYKGFYILFTMLPMQVFSQSGKNLLPDPELGGGPLFGFAAYKNSSASSLPFSGWLPGAFLSASRTIKNTTHVLSAYYQEGKLKNASVTSVHIKNRNLTLEYLYLRRWTINHENTLFFEAGLNAGAFHLSNAYVGLVNKERSVNTLLSAGVCVGLVFTISSVFNGLQVSEHIQVPMISAVLRSSDIYQVPDKNNWTAASFGSLTRVTNTVKMRMPVCKSNLLSIDYRLDFFRIKDNAASTQKINTLGVAYIFVL